LTLRESGSVRLTLPSALVPQAGLGLAQPAAPALRGGQLRRQLVAAAIAEPLILGGVDLGRLLQDLACQLLVIDVACREALAWILVTSIPNTSIQTSPACAHSPSTWPNRLASARSRCRRKRAIVV
jgi:hypothetical protein